MKKFYIEVDTDGAECGVYTGMWTCYGTITAEGNSLDELLDDASVDIIDQDGGTVNVVPADEDWMLELVTDAFYKQTRLGKLL